MDGAAACSPTTGMTASTRRSWTLDTPVSALREHREAMCGRHVLRRVKDKIALHQITNGSWGSALDDAAVTVSDNTAYTVKVIRK